jgi:tripartite-type tricarboxylate transporter receptor subunit TctC
MIDCTLGGACIAGSASGLGQRVSGVWRSAGVVARAAARLFAPIALIALIALGVCVSHAQGQEREWAPVRAMRLVVPQAAGGGADAIGRIIAGGLSERLANPVVVEDHPGANGNVGVEVMMRAPADGHTLLLAYTSLVALNPAVYSKVSYDPVRDFTALGMVCDMAMVFVASASVAANSVPDFIAAARAQPTLYFAASSGNGAFSHLLIEMFNARTGAQLTHVPYKGEGPAMQDLIGDRSRLVLFSTAASAVSQVRGGRVKGLGVTGARRSDQLPGLPTFQEQGITDINESFWYGLVVPAATPAPAAAVLERELAAAGNSPSFRQAISKLGCTPLSTSGASLGARISTDLAKYSAVARAVGMRID